MTKYSNLLYTGRFQPPHLGHCSVVDKGLELAEKVIIGIGSSQIDGIQSPFTIRNPLPAELRAKLWHDIYGDSVVTVLIPDRTHENDNNGEWGRWLLDYAKQGYGADIQGLIYSDDEGRSDWFYPEDQANLEFVVLQRNAVVDISATQLREAVAIGDFTTYAAYTHVNTHHRFEEIQHYLWQHEYYQQLRQ
ncbi:adenylyltransferase/cytidyltransferase family protein [Paenibacillus pabuli]|uniref:adenylyltransferase/cytidyltransferase family protein n=1 Tax=Paenibacillus pabuli TaxID=1472 RepID=UPI003242105F